MFTESARAPGGFGSRGFRSMWLRTLCCKDTRVVAVMHWFGSSMVSQGLLLDTPRMEINQNSDTDTLAERLRRRPAKPMGSARVGSNPTGVD